MTEDEKEEVEKIVGEVVKDQTELANEQELNRQDDRLNFQELCDTARHYSGLRFAMFTVFMTILGALLGLELRQYGSPPPTVALPPSLVGFFRFASLALAFLFGLGQWRVSVLIAYYQEKSVKFAESSRLGLPLQSAHKIWKWIVPITMLAPFVLAFFFWAWKIKTMICG